MRKTKKFISRSMMWVCLLVWLCAPQTKPTYAQVNQRSAENIPGIPAGYTIIDGDIQVPVALANAMRQRSQQERLSPKDSTERRWPQKRFGTASSK